MQTSRYGAIMEPMTKSWTDERLEERFDRIDERFDRVALDMREIRVEMKAGFDRIDARFDALEHLLIRLGGVVIGRPAGHHRDSALIAAQL
jgi:hypothetical protein